LRKEGKKLLGIKNIEMANQYVEIDFESARNLI
jgi:hypothetical protein